MSKLNTRITKDFLKKMTGEYDLEVVQWLELPNIGIRCIENLGGCTNIRALTLTGNQIRKICGLDDLLSLERLDLSSNYITRIENLEHLTNLQSLDLKGNQITNVDDVKTLSSLPNMRRLFLQGYQGDVGNPACQHPAYHSTITRLLPRLEVLDGESLDLRKHCLLDVVLNNILPDDQALKSPRHERWCEGFDWTPYPVDPEVEDELRVESKKLRDLLQDCVRINGRAKDILNETESMASPRQLLL
ncbi:unnamed protein product [Ascophyllum nodosum]